MATTKLGRPPTGHRMVPIIVMVSPKVKDYLNECAKVQRMSLSAKAREVLHHFYETR